MDSINMKDKENKQMNEDVITRLEMIKEHPELSTSKEAQNLLDYVISIVSEGYPIEKLLPVLEAAVSGH